jgi:beta-ureidopropionase
MENKKFSRRNFLKTSAITSGLAIVSPYPFASDPKVTKSVSGKLPREVWIAGISQMDLQTETPELMIAEVIKLMENIYPFQPDIVCLPETFPFGNVKQQPSISEMVAISEYALKSFAKLAKEHNCYIICPVITSEGGKAYNAAVVFDRSGLRMGEYRKLHLTTEEIKSGLTLGPLDPPVFQADFGKFGIQICYDIYWNDGWEKLGEKGAEIVFWPSAFAGGQRINFKACDNQYVVVSSTRKNTSKICDLLGREITLTEYWNKNFFCGSVNLEKVLVDTWPHVMHFNEILMKYGRKVRITTFDEEQWSVIESLSPDVFVADILEEFGIKSYKQDVQEAEQVQIEARKS